MAEATDGAGIPRRWVRYHWLATGLVGLFAGGSTVWFNIRSDQLKTSVDEATLQLKKQEQEFDQRLRDRASALEESRERIARFEFVNRTLSAVDPNADGYKMTLAINIVRLALSPEEQTGLFANLELASDATTKNLGRVGREAIVQSRLSAKRLQSDGFEALTKGELDQARDLFQKSEAQAPGEGVAYEMGRLLQKGASASPSSERAVLNQVQSRYIQYVPPEMRPALEQRQKTLEEKKE